MKPRTIDAKVERSHEARVIQMKIAEEGLPALMTMLTKMYNDPALAVIREYVTNAVDANIESGTDKPVDVYLPSQIGEPMFIVRDYGPGMDEQDIEDVYSKYVMSTKRDTDDLAGMFGIGSKSGLAYTSQILVESVKDGVKTSTTITRTALAPEISIDAVAETDQPSGTTVKIPVTDMNRFNDKARHHFKLLKPGIIHVNGEDIGGQYRDVDLGNGVYVSKELKKSYVVMGNVPYPLPDDIDYNVDNYGYQRRSRSTIGIFILEVPVGSYMPAPPREGLELSPEDLKRLKADIQKADALYLKKMKDEIQQSKTVVEGIKNLMALNNIAYNVVNKMGAIVIDGIEITTWRISLPDVAWDSDKNYRHKVKGAKVDITAQYLERDSIVFFYDIPDDEPSTYYFNKIKDYLNHKGLPSNFAGMRKKSSIPSGVDSKHIIKYEKVQNWSRPRKNGSGGSTSGTWREITRLPHKDNWEKARTPFHWGNKKIAEGSHGTRTLVYVSPSDYDDGVKMGMLSAAINADDVCFIQMGKHRQAKLKRDYPKAVWVKDWYENHKSNILKGFTDDHFRNPVHSLPDLDTDLHKRYNARVKELSAKRKAAIAKLGEQTVRNMSTGNDDTATELRREIEERYPYAPSHIYYKGDREKANTYVRAMDMYYKETE